LLLVFALLLGAALVVSPPIALSAERYTLTGNDIAIYNLAGTLQVESTRGSDVIVEVSRAGRDAAQLRVETGPIGARQTLRVIYPGTHVIYPKIGFGSNTNERVRRDGTWGGGKELSMFGNRVTISGNGGGVEAHADLHVLVPSGRNVQIHVGAGEAGASGVRSDLTINSGIGTVHCSDMRGTLALNTGSGSVHVRTVRGNLEVDTGSGDVVAEDIEGERLKADTGSGSVAINRARVSVLDIDTGSGGVVAEGVDASDVHVDTGSGRVSVELVSRAKKIDIDTGSGSVVVRVPGDYGAAFELDTGSGGVSVDLPHELTKHDDGYMRGTIGSGGGTLKVDTGSGGIQILAAAGRGKRGT
jgi:hypothetical protein